MLCCVTGSKVPRKSSQGSLTLLIPRARFLRKGVWKQPQQSNIYPHPPPPLLSPYINHCKPFIHTSATPAPVRSDMATLNWIDFQELIACIFYKHSKKKKKKSSRWKKRRLEVVLGSYFEMGHKASHRVHVWPRYLMRAAKKRTLQEQTGSLMLLCYSHVKWIRSADSFTRSNKTSN